MTSFLLFMLKIKHTNKQTKNPQPQKKEKEVYPKRGRKAGIYVLHETIQRVKGLSSIIFRMKPIDKEVQMNGL